MSGELGDGSFGGVVGTEGRLESHEDRTEGNGDSFWRRLSERLDEEEDPKMSTWNREQAVFKKDANE